ncbi:MAG: type II secretion system protein [Chloracidobacterium sp.]|nr:type II secretion system protein [Chloracidobacterium sp.]
MRPLLEKLRSLTARRSRQDGYTLFELIVTLTVLAVLVMGTIPLAQNAVRRQKEIKLRETLRQVRAAIDEFKRDTIGACPLGAITTVNPTVRVTSTAPSDPRSRVVIDDCTIFDTENLDRFPPSLDILVNGVAVRERGISAIAGSGIRDNSLQATELTEIPELTKIYLRHMPIDPITGESDWQLRSSYQAANSGGWDNINVFDIRSSSDEIALDGTKYSEW